MRYGFVFLSTMTAWLVAIILSGLLSSTVERTQLFIALLVLTVGLFLIGFRVRKS